MQYSVETISVDKAPLTASGVLEPLCNSCINPDCSNPIKEKTISIVGKQVKYRLYIIGNVSLMVVGCKDGYVGEDNEDVAMDPRSF